MAIEIVDLPIKNGDFPELFVCLPEGMCDGQVPWVATGCGHKESSVP